MAFDIEIKALCDHCQEEVEIEDYECISDQRCYVLFVARCEGCREAHKKDILSGNESDELAQTRIGGEMGDIELKECPFCGRGAQLWPCTYDMGKVCEWHVVCNNCGATVEMLFNSKEEAANAWNTRTPALKRTHQKSTLGK